jgi:hypothetical protein
VAALGATASFLLLLPSPVLRMRALPEFPNETGGPAL